MPSACHKLSSHSDFRGFTSCFAGLDDYHVRKRAWGPMQALMSVFALCEPGSKRSYADGCEQMFAWVGEQLGLTAVPVKSGLTRARNAVGDSDLKKVWDLAATWTGSRPAAVDRLLPGRALVGMDGTTLIMPRSASLSAAYGIRRNRAGEELCHYPEALLTSCWDLDTRMPLAWRIQSVLAKGGERAMAISLLDALPERSIVTLDAGFPSRKLFGEILDRGHDFVIRMVAAKHGSWPEAKQFIDSGAHSAIINTRIEQRGNAVMVPLRYIRRIFARGRPQRGQTRTSMIIVTSLPENLLSDEQIIGIYRQRWTIETIHDELKNLSDLETWHSTTKKRIEQEIFCHMLWHLFAGHISSHLEAEHRAANPGRNVRASTPRIMRAVADITNWLFESIGQKSAVKDFLRAKAMRRLDAARKSLTTKRQRKSRPRKAFHPYAKPRRNHGK